MKLHHLCMNHKERLLMKFAYSKSLTDKEEKVDKLLVSSFLDFFLSDIELRNCGIVRNIVFLIVKFWRVSVEFNYPISQFFDYTTIRKSRIGHC